MRAMQSAEGPSDQVFDSAAFLRGVDGNVEILRTVARLFLEECPDRLGALRDALARGDRQALEDTAHLLKGSASYFAAPRAMAAAATLERVAAAGDWTQVHAACAALEEEVHRLSNALAPLS